MSDQIASDIAALREALALNPTEGPFNVYLGGPHAGSSIRSPAGHYCTLNTRRANGYRDTKERTVEQMQADARYIAACDPVRLRRLLDALDARNAQGLKAEER